ncbi:MAG: hypothetical protein GXZ11_00265 [Tissierellia bacterium]|nr:hypothetical protein [Tissierellia bacterium]
MKKIWYKALGVLVLACLIGTVAKTPSKFSDTENRVLNHKIIMDRYSFFDGSFANSVEKYINDQFFCRQNFLDFFMQVEQLTGKRLGNDVFLGEDGYLLQRYNNAKPEQIDGFVELMETFGEKLNMDKAFMMLAPTSCDIMYDKLPRYAPVGDQRRLSNELENRLGAVKYVDVYDILSATGKNENYFRTDHHWTGKGAYKAANAFLNSVKITGLPLSEFAEVKEKSFVGSLGSRSGFVSIEPEEFSYYLPPDNKSITVNYHGDSELTGMYDTSKDKDKYAKYFGGNYARVDITNPNSSTDNTLLLIKDSYGNSMVPFLTPHYKNIIMLDSRYTLGGLESYLPEEFDHCLIVYNAISFQEKDWTKGW